MGPSLGTPAKIAVNLYSYHTPLPYGPRNITRQRRFAIGVIKSKGARSVAQEMGELTFNLSWVLDYLQIGELMRPCMCSKGEQFALPYPPLA
jgi:hypothetical protein